MLLLTYDIKTKRGLRTRDWRTDVGAKADEGWRRKPVQSLQRALVGHGAISSPEREKYKQEQTKRIRAKL
jgi:hypothetical protein